MFPGLVEQPFLNFLTVYFISFIVITQFFLYTHFFRGCIYFLPVTACNIFSTFSYLLFCISISVSFYINSVYIFHTSTQLLPIYLYTFFSKYSYFSVFFFIFWAPFLTAIKRLELRDESIDLLYEIYWVWLFFSGFWRIR